MGLDKRIIFIVSQPRAGSTYLQRLLSNNDKVNTVSEPWIQLAFAPWIKPELVRAAYDHKLTLDAFDDFLLKSSSRTISTLVKESCLQLYTPYLDGYDFFIDKTPRYWEILNELMELYPQSRFVILKRNPIDVAKSIIRTWKVDNLKELLYYHRDLLMAPFSIQRFVELYGDRDNVEVLRYEDLIEHGEETVSNIYNWLGLKYNDAVLDVSANVKHLGKYGDPLQNDVSIATKRNIPELVKFVQGYASFLGPKFLSRYGGYDISNGKSTWAFSYYHQKSQLVNVDPSISQKLKLSLKYRLRNYSRFV